MKTYTLLGVVLLCQIWYSLACSVLPGWETTSFLNRAAEADIIVHGTAVYKFPTNFGGGDSWPDIYDMEFEISCVIRGTEQFSVMTNLTGFGVYGGMCSATQVEEGKDYILFLRKEEDDERLVLDDINIQGAATIASDDVMAETATLCDIFLTSPEGATAQCPELLLLNTEVATCFSSSKTIHEITIVTLLPIFTSLWRNW